MEVLGVIAESHISFKITWTNPGGSQAKFDQTKQEVIIHDTDVYPDLLYTAASAEVVYLKYTAGSKLADLMGVINGVIEKVVLKKSPEAKNEASLPAPHNPKALPGSGANQYQIGNPLEQPTIEPYGQRQGQDQLGYKKPTQLPNSTQTKTLPPNSPDSAKPAEDSINKDPINNEPSLTPSEPVKKEEPIEQLPTGAYRVTVYGDKLRLIDGQSSESGGPNIKIVYRVSENLQKEIDGDVYDNTERIWAEVRVGGGIGKVHKLKFELFEEAGKDPRFAGNLLAQILPSVILDFTPEPQSSYSRKGVEDKLVDLISSTNITLLGKTESERVNILKAVANSLPGVDVPSLLDKMKKKPEEKTIPKK